MRLFSAISLLILASIVLAGCAAGDDTNEGDSVRRDGLSEASESVSDRPDSFQGVGESAGSLIIYAARNENLIGPLIDQFSELTGIDVRVKYGGTSQLAATLSEEGANSPADVFYTRDPGGLGAVSELLAALPEDILDTVPEWARSLEGKWVGTSARARVVAYNTDKLSEEDLPDSIEGFIDPKWKGRIGWSPTSGPTQTMVTAMRVIWGEQKTREWLEGIKANDATNYPNHTASVAGVGAGESDVGLVNHYYLLRFLKESGDGFPVRNYHLRAGGPGNLVMIVGAGILTTAKNRENAEVFLRFLLSRDAQEYLTEEAFDYPLIDTVATNLILKPLSEIQRPDINQALLGDIKGTESLMRDVGVIP